MAQLCSYWVAGKMPGRERDMRHARVVDLFLLVLITTIISRNVDAADRRSKQDASHESSALHGPAVAQVAVCFVPEQECDAPVVQAIAEAKKFIRVQAYGFTSPVILQALADARARGLDVQAILDKSDDRLDREDQVGKRKRISGARFTAEANIPTWIDDSVAIAHNKVIIIDDHLVIGGSYNYTAAAERRNAENVTFIDAPVVADFYLVNWEARKAASRPSRFQPDADDDGSGKIASSKAR
jgi:phosphatidylserine/phosphatidylglycerophosphate/cardiolipin synthase-like enzyme